MIHISRRILLPSLVKELSKNGFKEVEMAGLPGTQAMCNDRCLVSIRLGAIVIASDKEHYFGNPLNPDWVIEYLTSNNLM